MGDVRYALRMLAKSPGFSATAIGLLALGIGAVSVIFTAFNALLLKPLPVRHPESLVRMVQNIPRLGIRSNFEPEFYFALRDHSTTLAPVFGDLDWLAAMSMPAPAEQVRVQVVTPEYFDALGVHALIGRTLAPGDEMHAVLSYHFWQRRFHGDAGALGRGITLHGHAFTIVGILPREFNGIAADTAPDLRIPWRAFPLISLSTEARPAFTSLELAGRLKSGVSLGQAQQECLAMWQAVTRETYKARPEDLATELSRGVMLQPLELGVSVLRDRFGLALKVLAGCVGLLLLMACSNVAGLLLARGASRRDEIAVRLAIGATRARLIRQTLTESLLIALIGAAAGWLLAWIATPLFLRALPPIRDLGTARLQLSLNAAPDWRLLLFSATVAVLTAGLCGLAPAIGAARSNLDGILRGARSKGGWRGRRGIVVLQVALCTLLLAGAGLLVRTFERLRATDTGFNRNRVVTFTLDPGLSGYTNQQTWNLQSALMERVRNLSGVLSVAVASRPLMRGSGVKTTVAPEGQPLSKDDFLNTSLNGVSPEYFDTLGMRIVAGRALRESDRAVKPQRVVVNQAFARRFFPGIDPVGLRFGHGKAPDFEIVGVASDAKYRSLREPMTPTFYTLLVDTGFVLNVRTRMEPHAVIQPVRRALAGLDASLPIVEIHTMQEEVDASLAPERLTATLAGVFGIVAAMLAGAGIYGLLAYAVAQRRREIGIRMALGAEPGAIGRMIGGQALVMVACGAAAGIAASLAAGRWIRTLLYDISPSDALSLALAAAFVIVISMAASAVPARRAARVEPASTLRE